MTQAEWEQLSYFKPTENFGDSAKMNYLLLLELEAFRRAINTPIFISCGTQGKHTKDSFHYNGDAVDILFPEKEKKDIPDLYLKALKFNFGGIGIYPGWKYEGREIGGMHLDKRIVSVKATWIGVDKSYIAVDFLNLHHLFRK